jgi:hypothetical protein
VRFTGNDSFAPGTSQFLAMEIDFSDNGSSPEQKQLVTSVFNESTEVFALDYTLKMVFGYEQGTWYNGETLPLLDDNPELKTLLDKMTYERDFVSTDTGPLVRPSLTEIQHIL